jgi:hypothetical protein
MNNDILAEHLYILRCIAERGLTLSLKEDIKFVDLFQHMLDEIERLRLWTT